jgi:hypothetical protein
MFDIKGRSKKGGYGATHLRMLRYIEVSESFSYGIFQQVKRV